jgi:multidrug transporter EmrE-like cation transporter
MNVVFLMLALFLELAAAISLKLSHGFSKRIPALATVVFSALSLTLLSFALNVKGFEVGVVYAAWSGVGMAFIVTTEIIWQQREQWNGNDTGLPLALYLSWWYAPAFSVKSWAALRGYAGCEMLALSNWLLRRTDQIACAVFTPIDSLEHFKPQ